ncbi:hypothetical protein FA95DRAFT_1595044 [Auriscalpium vulgare]|uniref:Uncharacterized protein n=1 Tax=Auriscalpium vulgare TaxID=40419 RepID=A0ACB8RXB8_9AGAM|nr:hypothetical protein FA95DRAFT_1595044 [Auriscalpium vulgare]
MYTEMGSLRVSRSLKDIYIIFESMQGTSPMHAQVPPLTRPADYPAEVVKSDAHMERIRQRLLNEGQGAAIKKSEERRQRARGRLMSGTEQVQIRS